MSLFYNWGCHFLNRKVVYLNQLKDISIFLYRGSLSEIHKLQEYNRKLQYFLVFVNFY